MSSFVCCLFCFLPLALYFLCVVKIFSNHFRMLNVISPSVFEIPFSIWFFLSFFVVFFRFTIVVIYISVVSIHFPVVFNSFLFIFRHFLRTFRKYLKYFGKLNEIPSIGRLLIIIIARFFFGYRFVWRNSLAVTFSFKRIFTALKRIFFIAFAFSIAIDSWMILVIALSIASSVHDIFVLSIR